MNILFYLWVALTLIGVRLSYEGYKGIAALCFLAGIGLAVFGIIRAREVNNE